MSVQLNVKALRACLKVAAAKDVRYYLNGVFVEIGGGRIQYTATDGAALLTTWEKTETTDWRGNIIIPVDVVRAATKLPVKNVLMRTSGFVGEQYIPAKIGGIYFDPIKAEYPAFRHILKTKATTKFAPVNPAVAKRLTDAFTVLGTPYPLQTAIAMKGGGLGIGMVGGDEMTAVGVVMGQRGEPAKKGIWQEFSERARALPATKEELEALFDGLKAARDEVPA